VSNSPSNPYIRERTDKNSATGYRAEDSTDPVFFIEGSTITINGETVLTFIVLAMIPGKGGTTIRGKVRGSEFFDSMWYHFASAGTNIDVIQAEWTDGALSPTATFTTNLDAFNKAILVYPSNEDAALDGTVTGKYAKRKGYTRVSVVSAVPSSSQGQTGTYKEVIVQFRRP
jgi:hypothetical protein